MAMKIMVIVNKVFYLFACMRYKNVNDECHFFRVYRHPAPGEYTRGVRPAPQRGDRLLQPGRARDVGAPHRAAAADK